MAFTYKPLWKLLIDRNIAKNQLRKQIRISTGTLSRMNHDQYVGLKIISDICRELNCTPNDIIQYVPDSVLDSIPDEEQQNDDHA